MNPRLSSRTAPGLAWLGLIKPNRTIEILPEPEPALPNLFAPDQPYRTGLSHTVSHLTKRLGHPLSLVDDRPQDGDSHREERHTVERAGRLDGVVLSTESQGRVAGDAP